MTPRERVRRAIRFRSPDKLPILVSTSDRHESDIIVIDVVRHGTGAGGGRSEWGFEWERRDAAIGRPTQGLIRAWEELDRLAVPDPYDETRFANVNETRDRFGSDRYYIASLGLTGFTVMSALRGFAPSLEDLCADPEHMTRLADRIFEFEEGVIGGAADEDFDGAAFHDDWGTQNGLIVPPELWRSFFKPRYQRQFDYAHARGLDVYFRSCGNIEEIIPDLIEVGVDMLHLSEPELYEMEPLGARYRGQVCFVCPISHRMASLPDAREEIFREAGRLIGHLAEAEGGFIGCIDEHHAAGMTGGGEASCLDAFRSVQPVHHDRALRFF